VAQDRRGIGAVAARLAVERDMAGLGREAMTVP
jgi:hypothetical protein